MDRLWAPWRMGYVRDKKNKKCVFCQALKNRKKDYVIIQSKFSFSILNIFPYNNGHVMCAPKRHKRDISQLSEVELIDLFKTFTRTKKLLDKTLKPEGYNIGINTALVAGAGIAGHLHIHIVPRWRGDSNFMPVVYNTKVISQSLDELHKVLKQELLKQNG